MRVYDFDGTIYSGDSTYDFYFYLIKKKPIVLLYLPKFIYSYILYKLNIKIENDEKFNFLSDDDYLVLNKTYLKQNFFRFLNAIDNNEIDKLIHDFWLEKINQNKIFKYYIKQRKKDDVIISASPRFLLDPICKVLKCNLICSEVDKYTGKYNSLSCWWKEKVIRYKKIYGEKQIDEFYSDSVTDLPLALISKKSFRVLKNGKVIKWNF